MKVRIYITNFTKITCSSALDNMIAVINQVKGLPSTSNQFKQFFDITRCATIVNGERQVTNRGYLQWLNTDIPGTNTMRFSLRRMFFTNGIQVFSIYVDWLRHKRETMCRVQES